MTRPATGPGSKAAVDDLHRVVIRTRLDLEAGRIPSTSSRVASILMYEAFRDGPDGIGSIIDHMCEDWLTFARKAGIAVEDQDGDLLPGVLDAITATVERAVWFGLTEAPMLMGENVNIPYHLFPGVSS